MSTQKTETTILLSAMITNIEYTGIEKKDEVCITKMRRRYSKT